MNLKLKNLTRFPSIFFAFAGLSLAGCERMEPAPEPTVVLQSSGSFSQGETRYPDATLLVHQALGKLWIEIQKRETTYDCPAGVPTPPSADDILKCKAVHTTSPLATAEFKLSSFQDVLADGRGALQSELKSATLLVHQNCSVEKELTGLSGIGAEGSTQGLFKFEGTRWVQYNSGILERGIEGSLRILFQDGSGLGTALFEGMVTHKLPSRDHKMIFSGGPVAVGTSTSGHVEGAFSLGGTVLASHAPDSTHGNPASIALALPNGAGKIEIQGQKQVFDFNPLTDVTYPKGLGVMQLLSHSDERVEAEDRFQGHIRIPHIDFGSNFWCSFGDNGWCGEVTGTGTGDFDFALSIAVEPARVLVVASVSLSASVTTSEGKSLTYQTDRREDGSPLQVDTLLDW